MDELFDVVEIALAAPHRVRVLLRDRTKRMAEDDVKWAVYRRGVEHHFFSACPAGQFRDGDEFRA